MDYDLIRKLLIADGWKDEMMGWGGGDPVRLQWYRPDWGNIDLSQAACTLEGAFNSFKNKYDYNLYPDQQTFFNAVKKKLLS